MRLGRFSIAGLMGLVLIAALGFGGLKAATPLLASIYYSLALLALVTGVLVAIQSRGPRKAFFVGFSVVGWVYFSFTFVFPSGPDYAPPPRLLPGLLLDEAESWFIPQNNASISGTVTGTVNPTPLPTLTPLPLMVAGSPSPAPGGSVISPPPPRPAGTYPPATPASVIPMTTSTVNSNGTFTTTAFSLPPNAISMTSNGMVITAETTSFHHVGQSIATVLLAYLRWTLLALPCSSSRAYRNRARPRS